MKQAQLDDIYDPHDDFPTNPREAAEQIGKATEWLAMLSRKHGLRDLAVLIETARLEAHRQAQLAKTVN